MPGMGHGFRPTTRRSPPRSVPHWCTSSSSSCCSWSSWPLHGMPSERSVSGGGGCRTLDAPVVETQPYPEPAGRRMLRVTFGSSGSSTACSRSRDRCHSACRGPSSLRGKLLPWLGATPGQRRYHHLVNHPVSAAAATVWIQIGVGVFLLVAPRGYWSRPRGCQRRLGLVVWVFGEAFGGIFGHGSSWMFGSPGAVLFYAVAGALIALPDRHGRHPGSEGVVRGMGVFFLGMGSSRPAGPGVLGGQAHPSAPPGTLTTMVHQMAQVSQPSLFSSWSAVSDRSMHRTVGVNLVVVLLLFGIGPASSVETTGSCGSESSSRRPVPGRLDPRPGSRLLRRGGYRPQLDDSHGGCVHRRLPGHVPPAVRVQAPVESSGSFPWHPASRPGSRPPHPLLPAPYLAALERWGRADRAAPMAVAAPTPTRTPSSPRRATVRRTWSTCRPHRSRSRTSKVTRSH